MKRILMKFATGLALVLACGWLTLPRATAATKTWTGSGNWSEAANWSPGAPLDGDDAVIASGVVTVNVETVSLASFSNAATVVFSGWNSILHATNVTVNGTITHPPQSDTNGTFNSYPGGWDPDNRVTIVCSNLTVRAGASIDVTGKGYQGRFKLSGAGPGGSGNNSNNGGPGGSYGGKGGDSYSGTIANAYGGGDEPVDPGSAGGCSGVQSSGNGVGANGGGAVRIVADGTVTLHGSITANGAAALATMNAGGGSGGGIWIDCAVLEGAGLLSAVGGKGGASRGGGGGGRPIAVRYTDRIRVGGYTVLGGLGDNATYYGAVPQYEGKTGTYQTIAATLALQVGGTPSAHGAASPYGYTNLYAIGAGTWVTNDAPSAADRADGIGYHCIGWQALTNGSVQASGVTTQAVFQMIAHTTLNFLWTNQFELAVAAGVGGSANTDLNGWYDAGAAAGDLTATPESGYDFLNWSGDIDSADTTNNPVAVTMSRRRWITAHFAETGVARTRTRTGATAGDWFDEARWSPVGVPGPLDTAILATGTGVTSLKLPTAVSNLAVAAGATLLCSGWDTVVTAAGAIAVTGTVTHAAQSDANGVYNTYPGDWTPDSRIYLVCETLTVASGGKVDAAGKGYVGRAAPLSGAGPGGSNPGSNRGPGGTHGGKGGNSYTGTAAGNTYGDPNAPTDPGSAGGGYTGQASWLTGAAGGGVIRIAASGIVSVNGTGAITANGSNGVEVGAGAGGSIWIACAQLNGSGAVHAKGGNSTGGGTYSGGGGGGRIAVYYSGSIGLTDISVAAGTSYVAASNGTYVAQSTGVPLTVGYTPSQHGAPAPYGYGAHSVTPGGVVTNTVASPVDEAAGTRFACAAWEASTNGVVFAGGAGTQAVFTVTAETALTYIWTNEYLLAVSTSTNGSATTAQNGWYTNGLAVADIAATPESGFEFLQWSGDVPVADCRDNPLTVLMDRPRTLVAHFASTGSGVARFRAGGDWFAWQNWSPQGVPAPGDSVTITSGTVTLNLPVSLAGLAVSNGATLNLGWWDPPLTVDGDVTVAGTLAHADNTDTTGTIGQTNWTPNARINLVCRDLIVTGTLDANGHGYRGGAVNSPSRGPGGVASASWGCGGGYGGIGGKNYGNAAGGITYGDPQAPIGPGSGGGSDPSRVGGHGGGTIQVRASRRIRVDGLARATGGTGAGGGSGGAVFLAARVFEGSGTIEAKGANSTVAGGGGGGGGRIVIAATRFDWSGSLAHPASVAGGSRSGANGQETDGAPGTVEWITIPPQGTIIFLK